MQTTIEVARRQMWEARLEERVVKDILHSISRQKAALTNRMLQLDDDTAILKAKEEALMDLCHQSINESTSCCAR